MNIEVPVCFELGKEKELIISSTLDISATGLSLKMKESLAVGEVLKITMNTDETKIVKVDAQVMWIKENKGEGGVGYLIGLKIVDKMDQDEIEFVRFVAQQMFDYFKPKDEKSS
jgi:hypothetical protein